MAKGLAGKELGTKGAKGQFNGFRRFERQGVASLDFDRFASLGIAASSLSATDQVKDAKAGESETLFLLDGFQNDASHSVDDNPGSGLADASFFGQLSDHFDLLH
jgi:hypothetical protein